VKTVKPFLYEKAFSLSYRNEQTTSASDYWSIDVLQQFCGSKKIKGL
jgi:hypothetical protein